MGDGEKEAKCLQAEMRAEGFKTELVTVLSAS